MIELTDIETANNPGGRYILDGHNPVPEPDLMKWGEWMQTANRTVKITTGSISSQGDYIGDIRVSTVFLGLDHSFGGKAPVLFETMVFGGLMDQSQDRCSTWEAAEQMHDKMCEKCKVKYLKYTG